MSKLPAFLFGGLPGASKRRALEGLRTYVAKSVTNLKSSDGAEIRLTEKDIKILEYPPYKPYFADLRREQLNDQVAKALEAVVEEIQRSYQDGYRLLFLHSHLVCNLSGILYSWLSNKNGLNLLRDNIDLLHVVTFIENVFYIRDSTKDYNISINTIALWRDVETLVADLIARQFSDASNIRSDVISINQPMDSLYRHLFQSDVRRLYVAYPITEVRRMQDDPRRSDNAKKIMSQNKTFRRHFFKQFAVFDPTSIDEVLHRFYENDFQEIDIRKKPFLTVKQKELWPYPCGISETILGHPRQAVKVPIRELQEFVAQPEIPSRTGGTTIKRGKSVGLRAIRARDFRLIEQSDAVVFFRPTLKGTWSRGVREEFDYVTEHLFKPVCIIKDVADASLFNDPAVLESELGWVKVFEGDFDKKNEFLEKLSKASTWLIDELEK